MAFNNPNVWNNVTPGYGYTGGALTGNTGLNKLGPGSQAYMLAQQDMGTDFGGDTLGALKSNTNLPTKGIGSLMMDSVSNASKVPEAVFSADSGGEGLAGDLAGGFSSAGGGGGIRKAAGGFAGKMIGNAIMPGLGGTIGGMLGGK